MIEARNLSEVSHLRHAFFTRRGGISEGVYASLNCGYGSGDDSAKVRTNRERAMAELGVGADDLTTVHQVHSARVATVEKPWPLERRPEADGVVTRVPGVALGVLTADCAPVLFADREAGVIGAAHAGWRGALDGVLEATVAAMEDLGAVPGRISAALGPCIRQPSYEVGPEFQAAFVAAEGTHAGYFAPAARAGHFLFDLAAFVMDRLSEMGVASADDVDEDTYVDADRFFSYRRTTHLGEPDYGRGLSVIVMEGD